jgi:hypothetical protein
MMHPWTQGWGLERERAEEQIAAPVRRAGGPVSLATVRTTVGRGAGTTRRRGQGPEARIGRRRLPRRATAPGAASVAVQQFEDRLYVGSEQNRIGVRDLVSALRCRGAASGPAVTAAPCPAWLMVSFSCFTSSAHRCQNHWAMPWTGVPSPRHGPSNCARPLAPTCSGRQVPHGKHSWARVEGQTMVDDGFMTVFR